MKFVQRKTFFRASVASVVMHGIVLFALCQAGMFKAIVMPPPDSLPERFDSVVMVEDHFGNRLQKTGPPLKKSLSSLSEPERKLEYSAANEISAPESLPETDVSPGELKDVEQAIQAITIVTDNLMNAIDYSMLIMKAHQYARVSQSLLKKLLEERLLPEDRRILEGAEAGVTISFAQNGDFDFAAIESTDETLKSFLQSEMDYTALPRPRDYLLPYTKATFRIILKTGVIIVDRA